MGACRRNGGKNPMPSRSAFNASFAARKRKCDAHPHNTRDLPMLWIGFGLMAIGSLGSLSLQSDLCFNV
jgi:hypothetical protein